MFWTTLIIVTIDLLTVCVFCDGQNIFWGSLKSKVVETMQGARLNITYEQFYLASRSHVMLNNADDSIRYDNISSSLCADKCSEFPNWCMLWRYDKENRRCLIYDRVLNQISYSDAYKPTTMDVLYEKLVRNIRLRISFTTNLESRSLIIHENIMDVKARISIKQIKTHLES
jgi:hypothetical protein